MAIRMKEWGMMHAPAATVQIPVRGLMGWDSVARSLGEGVAGVLRGSAELAQGQERVQQTGELALFSQRLDAINAETRAELSQRDVKDWDYAWRVASEPRLAEAVAELPPSARQAGEVMAREYSRRASLEALRDNSVESIRKARDQWQQQVDAAVEQGDEQQARLWLEQGRDVFVAPDQEEALAGSVCSRARLARWKQDFAAAPLLTLERHLQAGPDDLPGGEDERQELGELAQVYTQEARRALVNHTAQLLQNRSDLSPELWVQAQRSGLISKAQLQSATSPHRKPGDVERCRWFRKVDEAEDDEESRLALQMDIATSPLPAQDRCELLQRLDAHKGVEREDRLTLSHNLWNLYNAGAFGCPGDAMTGRRMTALQRTGAHLLSTQGPEAAATWLRTQENRTDRWVCFSDLNQPTA